MQKEYKIIDQLNKETKTHSLRVADYARQVAKELGLDTKELWKMGLLHDIGKMYIPSRILKKSSNLADIERKIIDLHAYFSYSILLEYGFSENIAMVALLHHGEEKQKLSDVPKPTEYQRRCAKIIATVDCFDALTTQRVYHEAAKKEKAFKIIEEMPYYSKEALEILRKK